MTSVLARQDIPPEPARPEDPGGTFPPGCCKIITDNLHVLENPAARRRAAA